MRALDTAAEYTALEPGETLPLDAALGYVVVSGRVELYASLGGGDSGSGRHFLFERSAGDLIGPPSTAANGLILTILAVDPAELEITSLDDLAQQARSPEKRAKAVASLDGWIGSLCGAIGRLFGPPPTDSLAVAADETIAPGDGVSVTAREGVVWLDAGETPPVYCDTASASAETPRLTPVGQGVWLAFTAAGETVAQPTLAVLAQPDWPRNFAAAQAAFAELIGEGVRRRRGQARQVIESRAGNTRQTMDRVFDRLDAVLGWLKPRDADEYAADQPFVGPLITVGSQLGLQFTTRQRDLLGRARTIDEAARVVRLRNRTVGLRGDWRRQDLGPLIGFLGEERRPVALIRLRGKWHVVQGENARPLPLNDALAAALAPVAHTLYQPLPDRPLGFKEFIGFAWPRNRGDVFVAAAMSLAGALLGLATPFAMQLAFDRFIPGHQTVSLIELAGGLVLAAGVAAAFRVVFDLASLRITGRSGGALLAAVMDRVLRLPVLHFSPGDLASRLSSADGLRRTIWGVALGLMSATFFFITNIGVMFYYSPAAGGLALGLFVLLSAIAAFSAHRQVDELRRGEALVADIYSIVFQFVQGISALRTTGAQDRAFARWAGDFAELRTRMYRARSFATLLETGLAAFELLALAVILLVLAEMPRDSVTTGSFIAFISAYGAYMGASLQIARNLTAVWNAKPSWGRVAPLLQSVPEGAGSKRDPGQLTGAIDLTGVYFRYGPEAPLALQGVSLAVAPGEFVALVGPSGSGKSTLLRLLLGFDVPLSGAIQFDRQDVRFLDLELVRRQIGAVLQSSTLFPGTLYENIMGVYDGTMDDAWEAARQAGIEAEIRAMPMGMHTVVTEASSAFSGGQVQRMVIARALVAKPRILLLDEATSTIDGATQAVVSASLERLPVTRVVIAHRLATVKNADRILVFDRGKIVQTGRFDELVAAPGMFAELARRQLI